LNQLQNLASGDAIGELFETGNGVLAIGLASNIASTLNGLVQNTTSNDSRLMQQQKDASKTVKARPNRSKHFFMSNFCPRSFSKPEGEHVIEFKWAKLQARLKLKISTRKLQYRSKFMWTLNPFVQKSEQTAKILT
jgi:hypothetical protein